MEEQRRGTPGKAIAIIVVLAILLAIVGLSKVAGKPIDAQETLGTIDKNKTIVLDLTASAAAAATALAAVPGDTTTPVADEIADMASCFLVALAALYIEKFLVVFTGTPLFFVALLILFLMTLCGLFWNSKLLKSLGIKLFVFCFALYATVPLSLWISNQLEQTLDATFETTVTEAQELTDEINANQDSKGNFLERALEKIKGGVTTLVKKGEDLLNKFMESIAELIVVICGIPVLVMVVLLWLLKALFGVQIDVKALLPRRLRDRSGRARATAEDAREELPLPGEREDDDEHSYRR